MGYKDVGDELCDHCPYTLDGDSVNTNQFNLCEGSQCDTAYENYRDYLEDSLMKIKRVIFNEPATIIVWEDDSKTIVKCTKDDKFDKEKGFLMAFFKKVVNKSNTELSRVFDTIKDNETIKDDLGIEISVDNLV